MSPEKALVRSRFQLPIVKVRPGSVVTGILGDVGPIWFGVHWVGGRQVLCAGEDGSGCALCALGAGRVIGLTMIELIVQNARREFLLEVSPVAFSNFESRCRFSGLDLDLGVRCEVGRSRMRSMLRIDPIDQAPNYQAWLDGDRRLVNAWAVLYGLPLAEPRETVDDFRVRVGSVIQARVREQSAAGLFPKI